MLCLIVWYLIGLVSILLFLLWLSRVCDQPFSLNRGEAILVVFASTAGPILTVAALIILSASGVVRLFSSGWFKQPLFKRKGS